MLLIGSSGTTVRIFCYLLRTVGSLVHLLRPKRASPTVLFIPLVPAATVPASAASAEKYFLISIVDTGGDRATTLYALPGPSSQHYAPEQSLNPTGLKP